MNTHYQDSIKDLNANCKPKSQKKQQPPLKYIEVDLFKVDQAPTISDVYGELLTRQQYN
jgi:hypothetical protein